MKKNYRMMLSLLLVLVFVFQFSGSLAWAEEPDVSVTGNEALVYELYLTDAAGEKTPSPVSAEEEAEKLNGKSYALELGKDDPVSLSRSAGSVVLNDLLKKDLTVKPPEGFRVAQLYLRGDAKESFSPKKLPLSASADKATLVLKKGALAKGELFDKSFLSTGSTAQPPVYALVLVLAPIDAEHSVTVTVADDPSASGSVAPGGSFTAPAGPDGGDARKFSGWTLSYENGASLSLSAGDSFKPFADCRLEARWTPILTLTANAPVEGSDGFVPNGWTYSGTLQEGDSIDSVALSVTEQADGFVSVPSNAVISREGVNVSDRYELRYVNSEPVKKEAEPEPEPQPEPEPEPQPEPEKVKLTITANEPVYNESTKTFDPNNAVLSSGALRDGDSFTDIKIDVQKQANGSYIAVPRDAVIKNGESDVTGNYDITYVASKPVNPPAEPEKVKLTITANEPVYNESTKTFEPSNAVLSSGALRDGDSFTDIKIDVQKQEDGSYIAVPRDVEIKNGSIVVTGNYDITYLASKPVNPPAAPEKVKITITAKEPVYNESTKAFDPNGVTVSSGALRDGESVADIKIDVQKQEDGSYVAVPKEAVIKKGDTVVTEDYEISYVASKPVNPPAQKIAITVRSKDRTAEYSGALITADSYELVSGALADGHTMTVTYEGGSTDVTASPVASPIKSVVIKDALGTDVTDTLYEVTLDNDNAGKVTVTKHSITVTAITGTVETDGKKVIYAKDCKTNNGVFNKGHKVEGLLDGHELRGDFVKGYGSETFTTSIDLKALTIVDTKNSDRDVTANYDIKTVSGTLTIKVAGQTGVPVAVTVKDQSLNYDGAAHKPDQNGYSVSGLLDGDVASVSLVLKQNDSQLDSASNAGTYTIVPVVTIKTKDGAAVPENKYKISATNGTLTIKKLTSPWRPSPTPSPMTARP